MPGGQQQGGSATLAVQRQFSIASTGSYVNGAGDVFATSALSKHPTISGTSTSTVPVYNVSSITLSRHSSFSSSGVFTIPTRLATAAVAKHPTIASTGLSTVPVFHTLSVVISKHPTITSLASMVPPIFVATAALTPHHVLSGSATQISPKISTLFIRGTTSSEWLDNLKLSVIGSSAAIPNQATLAIPSVGTGFVSGWAPLAMTMFSPVVPLRGFNLVVKTDPAPIAFESARLFLMADDNGSRHAIPMFVNGDGDAVPHGSIGLAISGTDYGGKSIVIPLSVRGGNPKAANSLPIFLNNKQDEWPRGFIELYIAGAGVNPGYLPAESPSLNMHVARGPNAGMTLYVSNNLINGSVPMFISTHAAANQSKVMFVKGEGGTPSQQTTLVIPSVLGATIINQSSVLSIPKAIGGQKNQTDLFISGWDF